MSTGSIEANHLDWQFGKSYRYDRYMQSGETAEVADSEETTVSVTAPDIGPVEGIDISHPLKILPTCIPELTHATASFRSTLDYVFYTCDVFDAVEGEGTGSSIPALTHAEVDKMGGLPFDHYGSDHVLVCGDLKFRSIE
jgi:hypothetical protein